MTISGIYKIINKVNGKYYHGWIFTGVQQLQEGPWGLVSTERIQWN
jgi:hypothetical protein